MRPGHSSQFNKAKTVDNKLHRASFFSLMSPLFACPCSTLVTKLENQQNGRLVVRRTLRMRPGHWSEFNKAKTVDNKLHTASFCYLMSPLNGCPCSTLVTKLENQQNGRLVARRTLRMRPGHSSQFNKAKTVDNKLHGASFCSLMSQLNGLS